MKIKTRRYHIYYWAKFFLGVGSLIPLRVSLPIASFLGKVASRVVPKYRQIAVDNLNMVFSDNQAENVKIAENVFSNLAKNGAEWVKLSVMDPKEFDRVVTETEGLERLDKVLAAGRGAVVLGFHFGNWEMLGFALRSRGYPGALVARRIYFHKYDKFVNRLREKFDARVIYREESPKRMLRELKSGGVLGILADQDIDSVGGTFVDFFSKKAYTPQAPVKIAMAAKTQIVPIFIVRKKDNTHKLVVEDVIDVTGCENTEENVTHFTQGWTSLLEKYVRKYPEQWVWMHRRWKTASVPKK